MKIVLVDQQTFDFLWNRFQPEQRITIDGLVVNHVWRPDRGLLILVGSEVSVLKMPTFNYDLTLERFFINTLDPQRQLVSGDEFL